MTKCPFLTSIDNVLGQKVIKKADKAMKMRDHMIRPIESESVCRSQEVRLDIAASPATD